MKVIINGLDMGSSETAWVKNFEYKKEQQLIAEQMALGAPAAMELVRRASRSKTVEPHKEKLTWQSYVLQEA
eukprot:1363364-Prymnesium_polylepis.1